MLTAIMLVCLLMCVPAVIAKALEFLLGPSPRIEDSVSRNQTKTGDRWEQDYPWPECFEEDDL